jgi:hypothetical protein
VSYFRPWFLWPETKKLVIPFLHNYLIASLLSVHCVSPHRRSHKPRRISTLKTKNIIFSVYLLDHNLSLSMDHQFKEDQWCQDSRFQGSLQRKSISSTYLISITSLPEDEQTSKHGGGGRYNAIIEFKGEQIKKLWERKKKNEKEKERKRNKEKEIKKKSICIRKERKEKMWVWVKIK